jgi:hypothetical protein
MPPVIRNVPRPYPYGLGFYADTPLFGIHGTIFPFANGVHQTWCFQ